MTQRRPTRALRIHFLKPLQAFFAIVALLLKRQRYYAGLSLMALLNVILAVGLVTNASFFTQAVDMVVLQQELERFTSVTGRPPFSTNVYIFPSRRSPITLQAAEGSAQQIASILTTEVGLPLRHLNVQVSSSGLMLVAPPDSPLYEENSKGYLGNVELRYIENVAPEMEIVEGEPLAGSKSLGQELDVWVHEKLVQEMGLHLGEKLKAGINVSDPNPILIKIAGIWHAKDPKSIFWFNDPDVSLTKMLLIRRDDYIERVQPLIASATGESSWYIILDESQILPSKSRAYLEGFERGLLLINQFLPGARLNSPPLEPLKRFVNRSTAMTVLLLAYNLPAFGILLYFLVLTSTTIAQWQRREMSVFVSRGMSIGGLMKLILVEQLVLFAAGYPLGIGLGMGIARVMGYTESFLAFTPRAPLPVSLQGISIQLTLVALGISLFARLWPALRAARSSMLAEERERARPVRKPFWYRYYLDVLLLLPTLYSYWQLSNRGSLAGIIESKPEDLYRDPMLILVPALFVVTAGLLTMRAFNVLMRALDLLSKKSPWLTLHMALRQLGRQGLDYVTPLLLVIISLAMGVYTLSMAASLDQWLVDRVYYQTGADLHIQPLPPALANADNPIGPTNSSGAEDGNWIPLPSAFSQVPGVAAAARVGNFPARVSQPGGTELSGRVLAVDRAEFAATAWFRSDFAGEPLGALMNRLAITEDAVLIPLDYLQAYNLRIGDSLTALVSFDSLTKLNLPFTIVGVYQYFPTVYEEDPITLIGNFEYFSSWLGYTMPHDIWIKLEPGANGQEVVARIRKQLSIDALVKGDTQVNIAAEQAKMERVGIFGTLSVGFLATAVMAILSLLVYSYASLQERAYRFAVLHAVGLTRRQIILQVVLEYAFLSLFGAVTGALIGMAAADLFVPFFRFTGETRVPLPPLLPIIAGEQLRLLSLAFTLVIVIVEVATVAWVLRRRLAQMIKRAFL